MIMQHILIILLLALFFPSNAALLYPAATILQLTSSLSIPVLDLPPKRRVLFDWGFQMNYDLPFQVSSFYNIPIWPNFLGNQVSKRDLGNFTSYLNTYHHREQKIANNKHRNDFTAGELYRGFEVLLESYGYHQSCLLRSVCELAQHPFDDYEQKHMLASVLTFLLTPSLHQGFAAGELEYRELYELAELRGFLNENCTQLFLECKLNFLDDITKVIFFY